MQRKYCKSLSGERVGVGLKKGCVWGVVCVWDGDASSLNFKYFLYIFFKK